MTSYRLRCPKCGGEFDYEYNRFTNIVSILLGPDIFLASCPHCGRMSGYKMVRTQNHAPHP